MRYDISNSKTNSLDQLLYLDVIESIRANLIFNANDAWQGNNLMSLEISRGINVVTGQNKPHIERSRYFGTKDYTKVNATYTRLQNLPWDFAIFLSGQGQYSANPLLVAEEFGVGGEDFGIAYDYFEISGDSGYAGRAELRWSYFPKHYLTFLQPFVSFDGGQVFLKDTGLGSFSQSLTSLGGGFRFEITDFFNGQVEVGQPLTKQVDATNSKNARAFFYFTLDV
jgi:hemolysin activation/secretion protein